MTRRPPRLKFISCWFGGFVLMSSLQARASIMSELDLIVRFSVAQTLTIQHGVTVNEEDVCNLKLVETAPEIVSVSSEVQILTQEGSHSRRRFFACMTRIERLSDRSFGLDQTVCLE